MSNEEAIANIVRLVTTFHFEIKALPNDLKCAKCKSVLKNASQVPCGCRFCRTCIDDVISRGDQFCPGDSQQCGATHLSTAQRDYWANNSVLKLTTKCPSAGCPHECPLADMESHVRVCQRKNINCPFRELGCVQSALSSEEMGGHLLEENRSHCEMVANISRDMEILKQEMLLKDEQARHLENEMKLIIKENKLIKDENKSIKFENESIKREKEVLGNRVQQLSEKLKRDNAMVTAVTAAVASNRDEMKPARDNIRSIRHQSDCMKSIQGAVGLGQLDDWLIEDDVARTDWWDSVNAKTSDKFGLAHAFELVSYNFVSRGVLWIYLRIWAGSSNSLPEWLFRVAVTVIVAHRDRLEACSRQTRQCRIERTTDNRYSESDPFVFRHIALREAGMDLERGVRVSCRIVPVHASNTLPRRVIQSPVSSA